MLFALAGCATTGNRWSSEARVAFDAQRIVAQSARGRADATTARRVTIDDPVRVASISKLAVALGVMRLVDAGTLELDADVSTVLGWQLRNPAFPQTPITLRALLSHTASLRDGVDYTIPLGGTLQKTLADPKAWDAGHAPGRYFTYANIGFPVIASVMEKATGERFDALMQRLVFAPLSLDACFNWMTCSNAKVARHVVLYSDKGVVRRDDLHARRPDCPVFTAGGCDLKTYQIGENGALFSPQGGMRISMRDLATIGQLLLRRGEGFLTARSFEHDDHGGVDVGRNQRRYRRRILLQLWPGGAAPGDGRGLQRRHLRGRPRTIRSCGRSLWTSVRLVDRPGARAGSRLFCNRGAR